MSKQRVTAKAQTTPARQSVKCSVVLDVDTWTKLVAAATLRGLDRSTYAAEILRKAVAGVVMFDRAMNADHSGNDKSALLAIQANESEEEAA
jgi:hypothetical protein